MKTFFEEAIDRSLPKNIEHEETEKTSTEYPRTALAVHVAVFFIPSWNNRTPNPFPMLEMRVLTVIRNGKNELPGGIVKYGEKPKDTALRKLHEETNLNVDSVEKIWETSTFSNTNHDKMTPITSILFTAFIREDGGITPNAKWLSIRSLRNDDSPDNKWYGDHAYILGSAISDISGKMLLPGFITTTYIYKCSSSPRINPEPYFIYIDYRKPK